MGEPIFLTMCSVVPLPAKTEELATSSVVVLQGSSGPEILSPSEPKGPEEGQARKSTEITSTLETPRDAVAFTPANVDISSSKKKEAGTKSNSKKYLGRLKFGKPELKESRKAQSTGKLQPETTQGKASSDQALLTPESPIARKLGETSSLIAGDHSPSMFQTSLSAFRRDNSQETDPRSPQDFVPDSRVDAKVQSHLTKPLSLSPSVVKSENIDHVKAKSFISKLRVARWTLPFMPSSLPRLVEWFTDLKSGARGEVNSLKVAHDDGRFIKKPSSRKRRKNAKQLRETHTEAEPFSDNAYIVTKHGKDEDQSAAQDVRILEALRKVDDERSTPRQSGVTDRSQAATSSQELASLEDVEQWVKENLVTEYMYWLSDILKYHNKEPQLPIHVSNKDCEFVMALPAPDHDKLLRSMNWFLNRTDQPEIQRRVRVVVDQLHQLSVQLAWRKKSTQELSSSWATELDSIYRISKPWPTFSDVSLVNYVGTDRYLKSNYVPDVIHEWIKAYLGENESQKRRNLAKLMSRRLHLTKWWPDEDLENAKKQGLNIMAIVSIGDILHLGESKPYRRNIWDRHRATAAFERLEAQFVRSSPVSSVGFDFPWERFDWHTFNWKDFDWAGSGEHAWFLNNAKRTVRYRESLRDLVEQLTKYEVTVTTDPRIPRRAGSWWNSGDILLWHEFGLNPAHVIDVGDALGLKNHLDITRVAIDRLFRVCINNDWTSGGEKNLERVLAYFETRYRWIHDPREPATAQEKVQYILERTVPNRFHYWNKII